MTRYNMFKPMKNGNRIAFALFLVACSKRVPTDTYEAPIIVGTPLKTGATINVPPPITPEMMLVDGEYCPEVEQTCLLWLDPDNKGANGPARCAEFKNPSVCKSAPRVHKRFLIDKFEYPNVEGAIPQTRMTYHEAKFACESGGKRLCDAEEFTFACEGPEAHPYPYGDGYHRDSNACNIDHPQTGDPEKSPFAVLDQRMVSGANPRCSSRFGVFDMVGNVDELVHNSHGKVDRPPYTSGLKGGHWVIGARNRCRPMTTVHGPNFSFYVTGTRCCKDVK